MLIQAIAILLIDSTKKKAVSFKKGEACETSSQYAIAIKAGCVFIGLSLHGSILTN